MRIIILGAGLSGLTCAVTLKKQGHEVVLLEKNTAPGGLAQSFRVDGFTFDYGPHYLFGKKVVQAIQKEFPAIELNRLDGTKEKMFFHQKYFAFPFDPKNILFNMDKSRMPRIVGELLLRRLFSSAKGQQSQNLEDWIIGAVGRGIYDYISLSGYIQKLYGLAPSEISNEWGKQKLKFLAQWREADLIKLVAKSFSEGRNLEKRIIHYPDDGGIDHLSIKLTEDFISRGGEVLLNSEAVHVNHQDTGVEVTYSRNGELKRSVADFLISTIPITRLVEILTPNLSWEVRQEIKSLTYRNLLLLCLCIDKEYILDDQCIYFTEKPFIFRRITEFKHFDLNMAPEGKTSLCLEITCSPAEALYHAPNEDIFKLVIEQLERYDYLKYEDVLKYYLIRIPFAYPVYQMSYQKILEKVLDSLRGYHNLISSGRQGLFLYNAMNKSIIEGYEISHKISASDPVVGKEIIDDWYHQRLMQFKSDARH